MSRRSSQTAISIRGERGNGEKFRPAGLGPRKLRFATPVRAHLHPRFHRAGFLDEGTWGLLRVADLTRWHVGSLRSM